MFWDQVLSHVENRLSGWKSRFLSFGGRLILLKFVMTSLSVYAFSFFKALSGIVSSIKSILNNIFWVGVRIIGKILGLVEKLFVYERTMEGWG